MAFVCGRVSNGLECLDFDEPRLFQQFVTDLKEIGQTEPEYKTLLSHIKSMPIVVTPSQGNHLWYRCQEAVSGNQKLALTENKKTLIETRGEGGYAFVPPSPASCHPDGKPYLLRNGDLTMPPLLTEAQRELLLGWARTYNRNAPVEASVNSAPVERQYEGKFSGAKEGDLRPGDDFNSRMDWAGVLEPHGWQWMGERQGKTLWRRPGKEEAGISATTDYADSDLLYIFSSNAYPFEAERGYSKFSAYAMLNHSGDFRAAASQLGMEGYGDQDYTQEVKNDSWKIPVALEGAPRPPYPVEVLPSWLARYVQELAEHTQTPLDAAGMLVLAVCATAVATKFEIALPGWREPLNLFIFLFLPSASRKSEILRRVTLPLRAWERQENERNQPLIERGKLKQRVSEKRLETLEKQLSQASGEVSEKLEWEIDQIREELIELDVPSQLQLVADDVSPERLVGLLMEQKGRMSIMSAEGGIADIMKGRYSANSAPNIDVFLKGHAGDELRVDRVGRTSEYIAKPALTLGLAVQPEIMHGLRTGKGFAGRGLLGRILYSFPSSNVGFRETNPTPITAEAVQTYTVNVQRLLSMEPLIGLDGEPLALWLSPDAERTFAAFRVDVEAALRPDGEYGQMPDWGGKLVGATGRIAGLLHLAANVDQEEPWSIPVSEQTVRAAICLSQYLGQHARFAYMEMGMDESIADAKHVLSWIRRKKQPQFSVSSLQSDLRHSVHEPEKIESALAVLVEKCYIREAITEEGSKRGRKPSPRYEVNPAICGEDWEVSKNTHNTENTVSAQDDGWVYV